jgi:hypothetical protein
MLGGIDGHTRNSLHRKELGVTEDVKVMLEHLRDPEPDYSIWVDAICINKSSVDKRIFRSG